MNQFFIILCLAGVASAQIIPGRYIVELEGEPASSVAAASRTRFTAADPSVTALRNQIRMQHVAAEQSVQSLGGRVHARFETVLNGMAVELTEQAAGQLSRSPGVRGVYPDIKIQAYLDHAVNVHKIRDVWKTLPGGQANAGAGMKIGIIDSGIDITHPAFQGFNTAIPAGFPILSSESERPHSNNKVIVVRDYTGLGGLDTADHGTGVAMAAAGLTYDPQTPGFQPFSGVAPGAWLGNYRVGDDQGASSLSSFLQALDDAVTDGMNIVNYSSGGPMANLSSEQGPEARAISNAVAAGVLVVIAAGNTGPEPGTLGFPGLVSGAISVGANFNERILDDAVVLGDLAPFQAAPPSSSDLSTKLTGPMLDVTSIDPTGLGCSPYPANSLKGRIALIFRGTCAFDDKVNNADSAGAAAAVIYDNIPNQGLVGMLLATATLPAVFVANDSGLKMKSYLTGNAGATALLDFTGSTSLPFSSDAIPAFTSSGPTPGGSLKPDLLATGAFLINADSTQNNPDPPFSLQFGTSFSSPIVAGAAAVLMSSRPGLTAAQYRSLLVNSSHALSWPTGGLVPPQISGAGKLDLSQAESNTAAAAPSSLSFQVASGTVDLARTLSVSNVGAAADTYSVAVKPLNTTGPVPAIDTSTFSLNPGASRTVSVRMAAGDLTTGEYHGYVEITGTKSSVVTRVPYWMGVAGSTEKFIAMQRDFDTVQSFGNTVTLIFRTLDAVGLPFAGVLPDVSTTAARASVVSVDPYGTVPGTYRADIRIGRGGTSGTNTFTITAGTVKRDIVFQVR